MLWLLSLVCRLLAANQLSTSPNHSFTIIPALFLNRTATPSLMSPPIVNSVTRSPSSSPPKPIACGASTSAAKLSALLASLMCFASSPEAQASPSVKYVAPPLQSDGSSAPKMEIHRCRGRMRWLSNWAVHVAREGGWEVSAWVRNWCRFVLRVLEYQNLWFARVFLTYLHDGPCFFTLNTYRIYFQAFIPCRLFLPVLFPFTTPFKASPHT